MKLPPDLKQKTSLKSVFLMIIVSSAVISFILWIVYLLFFYDLASIAGSFWQSAFGHH